MAAVAVVAFLVYLPALRNDFVNWDDPAYVYESSRLRESSWSSLASHFFSRDSSGAWTLPRVLGNYHPLTMVSLHLDRWLSASDPERRPGRETELHAAVFHATSVALHVASTVLVFFVFRRLLLLMSRPPAESSRVAALAAALFGIATLHVESVAWISERKDVLYAFLFWLALLAWLEYVGTGARRWYAAALAAFLGSLLSKGQAVTFAAVIIALDLVVLRRPRRGRVLLEKLPFLALALAFGLLALRAQSGALFVADAVQPWWMRPLFAAYGLVHSLFRLFVPVGLLAHYTYAQALARPLLLYAVCPVAAALFLAVLVSLWRREPLAGFGLVFFLLTIAPVLQLLPVGSAVMADRYSYVPSAGAFLACAVGLERLRAARPEHARRILGAFAVYAAIISAATIARISVWRTSETLWAAELAGNPSSSRAHNNLGLTLRRRSAHADSEAHFRRAVEIDPRNLEAWNNLGLALDALGRTREAAAAFDRALADDPSFLAARVNRAATAFRLGDFEAAAAHYGELLRVAPRHHVARGQRIEALRRLGRSAEAEAECRAGLALEPGSPRYSYELARVLLDRGAYAEAAAHLREAVRLEPDHPDYVRALAWLLATAPDTGLSAGEASRVAARAVELTRGQDALALYALGLAESAEGDGRQAGATLQRALTAAVAANDTALANQLRRQLAGR